MAHRGLLKIKHNPEQLFDVTLQPIIFTLMFTYIFGGAISGNVSSYLPVIIPGILVQTVVMSSIVTGTQLREDMDKGVFDRFRTMPMSRIAPVLGPMVSDVLRYLVCTCLTVLTGWALGYRPVNGWSGAAGAVARTACRHSSR